MISYEFLTTQKIEEALNYLDKFSKVHILAGGTDLLVNLYKESPRLPDFDYLLDISNISELKFLTLVDKFIEIGPLVTHSRLINDLLIKNNFPVLIEAACTIGSTQIRNRGTIGGNIVNASPAADLLPPLIALRAEVELTSGKGKRVSSLEEFLAGPYKTKIQANELLTKIKIPLLGDNYYTDFQKIGRRKALSIARLSLALVTKIDKKGIFHDTRVAPGSATPYPQSLPVTEEAINGKSIFNIDLEDMGKITSKEMVSITGERWSTPYKKPTIAVLIKRALEKIVKEAKTNE
ncbi:MAG TPA: xanthine dehydrogenase family protein subunit M [Candidatus Atribacteria bacterium]|nr:xanthine dehydrogenase family protein subunit M [Candidatus Atribacteria bacterium]